MDTAGLPPPALPARSGAVDCTMKGWAKMETYVVGQDISQSLLYRERWFELWGPYLVHFAEERRAYRAGHPGDIIDLAALTAKPHLSLKLVINAQRVYILHTRDQAAWLEAIRSAIKRHATAGGGAPCAPLLRHPPRERTITPCEGATLSPPHEHLSSLSSPPPAAPAADGRDAAVPYTLDDLRFDTGAHGTDGETRPCSFGCVKQGVLREVPVAARLVQARHLLAFPPPRYALRRQGSRPLSLSRRRTLRAVGSPGSSASSSGGGSDDDGSGSGGSDVEVPEEGGLACDVDLTPLVHASQQCRALNRLLCVLPSRNRHGDAQAWVISEYLPHPLRGKVGEPRARVQAAQLATAIETLQRERLGPHLGVNPFKVRTDARDNAVLTGAGMRSIYSDFRRTADELEPYHTVRCDWWSLGAVLYFLVAGTPPKWFVKTHVVENDRDLVLPFCSEACGEALQALLVFERGGRVRSLRALRKLAFFRDVDFSFRSGVPGVTDGPEEFGVYELQGQQVPRRVLSPGRASPVRQHRGGLKTLLEGPHSPAAGATPYKGVRLSTADIQDEAHAAAGDAPGSPGVRSPGDVGVFASHHLSPVQKRLAYPRRHPAKPVERSGLCRATLSSSGRSVEQVAKALALKRRNQCGQNPPLKHASTPIDPRGAVEERVKRQQQRTSSRRTTAKRTPSTQARPPPPRETSSEAISDDPTPAHGDSTPVDTTPHPTSALGARVKKPHPKPQPKRARSAGKGKVSATAGSSAAGPPRTTAMPRDCALDLYHSAHLDHVRSLEPHMNPTCDPGSPQRMRSSARVAAASVRPGTGRIVSGGRHVDAAADYMRLPLPRPASVGAGRREGTATTPRGTPSSNLRDMQDPRAGRSKQTRTNTSALTPRRSTVGEGAYAVRTQPIAPDSNMQVQSPPRHYVY